LRRDEVVMSASGDVTAEQRLEAMGRGMTLSLWASTKPDAPAVVSEHGTRSFADLNGRANQLVRALRRGGIEAGDSVALLCGNRAEFAEAVAATQRAGLRLTPINWHLRGDEAGYILHDCEAKAFVAEDRFADVARDAAAQAPRVHVRLSVGGRMHGFDSYEEALALEASADIADPTIGGTMLYTSGTTGRPKGVHRQLGAALGASSAQTPSVVALAVDAARGPSLHLCTGPLYHAAPLAFSLLVPLAQGMGVVVMDQWDAEATLQLVERHQITHSHMVPTMFHRLLSLPERVRQAYDASSLRFVIHGAAPCPVAVKRAMIDWWGPILVEYYAATEGTATFVSSEEWLARPGTVGRPPSPDHVRIFDDDGKDVAPGDIGTIYIKAPEQARFSYYKHPEKTAAAFRGGHYTLGDVGYLDEDGYLYLTDRSADLIISGGVNVYPAETEAVLIGHPAVGDVAVIGVPNTEWGEEVKAIVELQPGSVGSSDLESELISWSRERLASFKCPRTVEFTDALPRQDNGKLYKRLLRDRFRQQVR
jgi:long-chain acyl-CoA synthetase